LHQKVQKESIEPHSGKAKNKLLKEIPNKGNPTQPLANDAGKGRGGGGGGGGGGGSKGEELQIST